MRPRHRAEDCCVVVGLFSELESLPPGRTSKVPGLNLSYGTNSDTSVLLRLVQSLNAQCTPCARQEWNQGPASRLEPLSNLFAIFCAGRWCRIPCHCGGSACSYPSHCCHHSDHCTTPCHTLVPFGGPKLLYVCPFACYCPCPKHRHPCPRRFL